VERSRLDEELCELEECLARMGARARSQIESSLRALVERRADLARRVIDGDAEINELQMQIDDRAFRLLALQQPAARDLRFITAAVRANADLERLGDQAVNVAQSTLYLLDHAPLGAERQVEALARFAIAMLRDALDSFLGHDAEIARAVLVREAEADRQCNELLRDLLDLMVRDPLTIEPGVGLMLVTRNMERVADHATNLAEDAIFSVEARDVRHLPDQQAS
jgi:phosphate transport system protein